MSTYPLSPFRLRLPLRTRRPGNRGRMILLGLLMTLAACRLPYRPATTSGLERAIRTGAHADEGPADRYAVPYTPITYGQEVVAPLPGLAYDYTLYDWDDDGRPDIVANIRRGGGLVFYKNVGTTRQPRYRMLQDNPVLLPTGQLGRYFGVIDLDHDGTAELIGYEGQPGIGRLGRQGGRLGVYENRGTPTTPEWTMHYATTPHGDTLRAPEDVWNAPRLSVADCDQDGQQDLIIGYEHINETVPPELPTLGGNRMAGFRDPDQYRPYTGELYFLRNRTRDRQKPVFDPPRRLAADGRPIVTFIHPYPTVFDINRDSLPDLLVGTHRAEIRVFVNVGRRGRPQLTDRGLLSDPRGQPIRTFLTVRMKPADLDGDGSAELVGASYFGNQNRYVVYRRRGEGWQARGYLSIRAQPHTPVYGMGNSTIDPVDWDGDGDTDLLLGAEGAFPTVVINVGTEQRRVFDPPQRLQYLDGSPLETFSIEEGVGSHWGPLEWYSDRIAPRAVDWDGDGTLDLISGSMGRRLYFFKGQKVANTLRFHPPVNFTYRGATLDLPDRLFPAVPDWTGDGKPDVIVSDDPGHVLVYPGDGSLALGDPDTLRQEDGRPIVLEDFWERKKGNRSGFAVADWDGDGQRDVVIFQFHRGVFLFRNNGSGAFAPEQRLVPLYSHLAGPSVMDWDGDGYPDLLIGGDERRMIEPATPAHLVVFHGQDAEVPAVRSEPGK